MAFHDLIRAGAKPKALERSAYEFSFSDAYGKPLPLSAWEGKVILVVNIASQCMFTKQLHALQTLYQRYHKQGLVILAVPSNDFRQEPKENKEIKLWCRKEYEIDFIIAAKESVRGSHAHPFYIWAQEVFGGAASTRWNFHKYIVTADGKLNNFFLPFTNPMSGKFIRYIESTLPQ